MSKQSSIGKFFFCMVIAMTLTGCTARDNNAADKLSDDTVEIKKRVADSPVAKKDTIKPVKNGGEIVSETVQPDSIVAFARTLIGIPYLYASTDPAKGLDCSGFITNVFNHFNITVPRSSVDFTNYGKDIGIKKAKPGDLILFTGTDSAIRIVGHMGIVESIKNDTLYFIHSTSGKAMGVVISPLGDYYKKRFVKVIRVFRDDFFK
jgi:cell wall-associated NlpC family hydrolase